MNIEQELKIAREKISYICRYMDGISPKVSRYQELVLEKAQCQARLKQLKKMKPNDQP